MSRAMGRAFMAALLLLALHGPARAATVEYIHTDALGSPVAVTNAAGQVIERSEYEPYGTLLNRPLKDGPGFTGHVSDAATGLSYMQQRYYDPGIGRFLSVDPVTADGNTGGNFNRYWYANNNPYRFYDPDGRCTGSRITNDDGTCKSTGSFTTMATSAGGAAKRGIENAWRGIAAHKIIQQDVQRALPDHEVKAERRSMNPLSGKFGRIDLMIRKDENTPWSVFEIKPGGHQSSSSLVRAATLQLGRYVESLRGENERAVVGNWSQFFSGSYRAVTTPSMEIGGIDFGGSYSYGPGETDAERGIIYYSTGVPTLP